MCASDLWAHLSQHTADTSGRLKPNDDSLAISINPGFLRNLHYPSEVKKFLGSVLLTGIYFSLQDKAYGNYG